MRCVEFSPHDESLRSGVNSFSTVFICIILFTVEMEMTQEIQDSFLFLFSIFQFLVDLWNKHKKETGRLENKRVQEPVSLTGGASGRSPPIRD